MDSPRRAPFTRKGPSWDFIINVTWLAGHFIHIFISIEIPEKFVHRGLIWFKHHLSKHNTVINCLFFMNCCHHGICIYSYFWSLHHQMLWIARLPFTKHHLSWTQWLNTQFLSNKLLIEEIGHWAKSQTIISMHFYLQCYGVTFPTCPMYWVLF